MLFLLGLLSVVQIVFLPGYLLLRAMKLNTGFICSLIVSFALSFIVNHFIVIGLVFCGLYHSTSLYILFALESVFLLRLLRGWRVPTLSGVLEQTAFGLRRFRDHLAFNVDDKHVVTRGLILLTALLVAGGCAMFCLAHIGHIFSLWDAVVSWNRWAIQWSENRFPDWTMWYPQLLPSNWSMTYVFLGDSSIWFFAKAVMPLFMIVLLLALLDLYMKTRHFGYVLAIIVVPVLLGKILGRTALASGYADIPVAVFSFIAVYLLLLARIEPHARQRTKLLLIGAIVAGGAALTKQAGLFIAIVYPLLAWGLVLRRISQTAHDGRTRSLLLSASLVTILVVMIGPWYGYKYTQIRQGLDSSNISYLVKTIHQDRSIPDRLVHAGSILHERIYLPTTGIQLLGVFVSALLLISLRDPVYRWITPVVVVPFLLIWGIVFSYDTRNIAIGLLFGGTALSMGLLHVCRTSERLLAHSVKSVFDAVSNLFKLRLTYLVAPFVLGGLLVAHSKLTPTLLAIRQTQLQREVGMDNVNHKLYEFDARVGIDGEILTDYLILEWLPGLREHCRIAYSHSPKHWLTLFNDPQIHYALIHKFHTAPEVWSHLKRAIDLGECRLVFDDDLYRFYSKTELR